MEEEGQEEEEEEEGGAERRLWVMGYGLEAACMCIGISRRVSRGPLEGSLFGAVSGPLGASWGLLGASWGPLGGLWRPLGALLGLPGARRGGKLDFLNI